MKSAKKSETAQVELSDAEGRTETLAASPVGRGLYSLEESPAFAYSVSLHDVVRARRGRDGRLRFAGVVEKSGNRTLRLIFARLSIQSEAAQTILESLAALGCRHDNAQAAVVSINVPAEASLAEVAGYLKTLGMWWEHADPTFEELYAETD
ncbi:MAG TPA: DUF4265 domain-containing protein [Pyrinomonadaceae bacterium]|jgi:hypothetical protein|nr:DUF4265 domain-containing protein [Pyrinomonadaceae bacterium]